jgi:hypothetical protein
MPFSRGFFLNRRIRHSGRLGARGLHALDLAVHHAIDIEAGPLVVLAAVQDPGAAGNKQDDAKCDDGVVHVIGGDGNARWENEENGREDGPGDANLHTRGLAEVSPNTD